MANTTMVPIQPQPPPPIFLAPQPAISALKIFFIVYKNLIIEQLKYMNNSFIRTKGAILTGL